MQAVEKLEHVYARRPESPFYCKEFGYYCLDRWIAQGHLDPYEAHRDYDAYLRDRFGFDSPAMHVVGGAGGTEAPFDPCFPEMVLEDRGAHEVVQDTAGRQVLCFKGRRSGFMPEYLAHPVTDMRTFEEHCLWRLDPDSEGRIRDNRAQGEAAQRARAAGQMISQTVIGAYMYLRSLIGPLQLLYAFYDDPELIHACMRAWLRLMDAILERQGQYVAFDELLFDEDICYKNGPLISHDMMRTFLFPYYRELTERVRHRQKRPLHIQIGTDGRLDTVIDIYRQEIGADFFSPCEVAAGCDVVAIGRQYPDLILSGGIDKRVLAGSRAELKQYLDAVLPVMYRRGGYIPTCDHGVPEEVPFDNYVYFRDRVREYAD